MNTISLIPARALNEVAYCPRLFHLMYVQCLFDDSADTLEGSAQHQRRKPRASKKTAAAEEENMSLPWDKALISELTLSSAELGIIGKFDALKSEGKEIIPIEDKHGPAPDGKKPFVVGPYELSPDVWGNDQIQLAAQMALLQTHGHLCRKCKVYYRKTNTMTELLWSDNLEKALLWAVNQAREISSGPMPEPLNESMKCIRCSLNHICLPDETLFLSGKLKEPRQLHPGREMTGVLYLTEPGTKLGKRGENLTITHWSGSSHLVPLKEVANVCITGNCQITTQALSSLTSRGATIAYLSGGGWLKAVTSAPLSKNVSLRRDQFLNFSKPSFCLPLAASLVKAKIANQRTLLRRNNKQDASQELDNLKIYYNKAGEAESLESLRGYEGLAAREYWKAFPSTFSSDNQLPMKGRNRRPPKDPVNAMLSYGYTLLVRDFYIASISVGMDPLYGFYHSLAPGRPALALDLMEPYRPLVVDSAVLRVINEGILKLDDFMISEDFCAFKKTAKKKFIAAYERRVDELITHPAFGYRLSYRRVMHLEARLLSRVVEGELEHYEPLTTR